MRAVVVYESLWGNTAAVAHAIAEGLGPDARALSTAEATAAVVVDADLIVAGAPVFAFHLSSDKVRDDIRGHPDPSLPPPDLSHPSMRDWLAALPAGAGRSAAFDTQVKGPFGKGAPTIAREFEAKGYARLADPVGFLVKGKSGPLHEGEVERARAWGVRLTELMQEC